MNATLTRVLSGALIAASAAVGGVAVEATPLSPTTQSASAHDAGAAPCCGWTYFAQGCHTVNRYHRWLHTHYVSVKNRSGVHMYWSQVNTCYNSYSGTVYHFRGTPG